jgi:hemolysin III
MRANIDHGSGVLRPTWRGRFHALGALLSAAGGAALVRSADTTAGRTAVVVLTSCMTLTYAVSAWYHIVVRTPFAQAVLKRLDHAMIFVLIAGSHTALCVVTLKGPLLGWAVVTAWLIALGGVLLKLTGRMARMAEIGYAVAGWGALSVMPWMWATAGVVLLWVLLSGVLYSAGAVAFAKQWPRKTCARFGYHEVWHVVTLLSGALHFVAVARLAGV